MRPRVKRLSMILHQGSGYRIKGGYVKTMGRLDLRSLGDGRYDQYEWREASL